MKHTKKITKAAVIDLGGTAVDLDFVGDLIDALDAKVDRNPAKAAI
jgi:hypothetical protein